MIRRSFLSAVAALPFLHRFTPRPPKLRTLTLGECLIKFRAMRELRQNWDSYKAEPPTEQAINRAQAYVVRAQPSGLYPTRVSPSVMGGVGVTYKNEIGRRVYVEFFNSGNDYALWSDGVRADSRCIDTPLAQIQMIRETQEYLA